MEPSTDIFIIAGEASGDTYGAALMKALHQQIPTISFLGAGGPKMAEVASRQFKSQVEVEASNASDAALTSASNFSCGEAANTSVTPRFTAAVEFDDWIETSAVVGLWDVLKKYGYFRSKFSKILKQLEREKPQAIILIDYPGFNLRLAKAIRRRKLPIKIFYYISPQVWAWHKSRIPKMARLLDLMICIFPFEKELYESSGLPTTFVGHPLVETIMASKKEAGSPVHEQHLLGLFPGSREREVRRLFPVMIQAAQRVMTAHPEIQCEAAAATPAHAAMMQEMAQEAGASITITTGKAHHLMQRATFGLVCSGTATLEAACYGLPYALVYKVAWLTYVVGRQLIRVPFLGIINILAGRLVVKEFIQQQATPEALANEALRFLTNPQACQQLAQELTQVVSKLHGQGAYDRAAATMIKSLRDS